MDRASTDTVSSEAVSYEGLCWPVLEQRALLRVLHAPPDVAVPSFRLWTESLDVDRLDHGSLMLMPLLHERLTLLGIEHPILPRLRGARHYHWSRNQVRLRRCFQGLDLLRSARVPLLALKGLAALELYADLGLRPMSDIDLLVPRDRAVSAVDALLGAGWRLKYGKQRSELSSLLATRHGFTLEKDAEIDVHWFALAEDRSAAADQGLWERAVTCSRWGRELLAPSAPDLLLHTLVHGARFNRSLSAAWVPDSVRIIEKHGAELDWSLFVAEARRRVLELPLRETLRYLREELLVNVPQAVLDELAPREPAWLFWLDHRLYAGDPRGSTSWHRAAARVVDRLRQGVPLPVELPAPPVLAGPRARN